MSKCHEEHGHTGRVSTHDDLVAAIQNNEPHMSIYSCDRPECIRAFKGLIRREMGLSSDYYPFARKAATQ